MLYYINIDLWRLLEKAGICRPLVVLAGLFALSLTSMITASPVVAAPKVAVSIKPLHGLVSGVMEGVGKADLIFSGFASPHSASFKPSQMRSLRDAELIFWIGKGLEPTLARALRSIARPGSTMSADTLPGLKRWPLRTMENWRSPDHGHSHNSGGGHGRHDPHIWLDTENAAIIVRAVAGRLAAVDPANAAHYRGNEKRMLLRLTKLTKDLEESFTPVRERQYFVQHDAYQYLEKQFSLHPAGIISISQDHLPGPKHLSKLRRRMVQAGAVCVFADPQASHALSRTLAGTQGRIVPLDIMGSRMRRGPHSYFRTMSNLAQAITRCLGSAPP